MEVKQFVQGEEDVEGSSHTLWGDTCLILDPGSAHLLLGKEMFTSDMERAVFVPLLTCEGQGSTFRSWFSPSPGWVSGIELRSELRLRGKDLYLLKHLHGPTRFSLIITKTTLVEKMVIGMVFLATG